MALNRENEEYKKVKNLKAEIESASPLEKANYVSVKLPEDSNVLRIAYVDMARKLSVARAALEEIDARLLVNTDLHHYFHDVIAYALGFNTNPPDPAKYDIEILTNEGNDPVSILVMPVNDWEEVFNLLIAIANPEVHYNPGGAPVMAQEALSRQRSHIRRLLVSMKDATSGESYVRAAASLYLGVLNDIEQRQNLPA